MVPAEDRAFIKGALPAAELPHLGARVVAAFHGAAAFGATGHLWLLSPDGVAERGVVVEVRDGAALVRDAATADREAARVDPLHREAVVQFGVRS